MSVHREPNAHPNMAPSLHHIDPTVEYKPIVYDTYEFSKKEYMMYALLAGGFLFLLGMLFYKSIIASSVLAALGFFYPRIQRKKLIKKRKMELNLQFKQAISSLSSSLAAGRSVENSFFEVARDLRMLYPDPNTYIIREVELINRRVENGGIIERAIEDFALRANVEDITNFADVFATCKRTGGDLVEVIRRTSTIITEKLDIQQEISVMVAQKRFESKALSIAPLGMIALLTFMSGDYMDPLYQWEDLGPIIMTVALGVLIFSYWLSQKIMNIKV